MKNISIAISSVAAAAAVLTGNAAESTESPSGVVYEQKFATAADAARVEGAEFVPGGGPDGRNAIKVTGKNGRAAMPIDAELLNLLRGRLVTVEAMVRGENLPGGGNTLFIAPKYTPGPGEYYPSRSADKGNYGWRKFAYSIRIPDYCGNLQLIFDHAGKSGTAYYADLKFSLAPLPEPLAKENRNTAPLQKTPKYRGAMVGGGIADPEVVRIFGQEWHGNLIRYQFGGGGDQNTPEKYRAWGQARIAALDKILPELEKNGIKVVIDLHSGPATLNAILQNVGIWTPEAQEMIVDLWKEIARHFKGNPNIYGYDILNEPLEPSYVYTPDGALDWNRFAERIAKAIREIDPDTPIIVACAIGGNPVGFGALKPINVPNTIYTVHCYLPHGYTHQGVHGAKMVGRYPGVKYDGQVWNKEMLRRSLEPVVKFQQQYHVPIFVGEFGVARWAPGAEQYLTDYIDLFEEYGWDWTFHAFREWDGWSAEHSIDPDDKRIYPSTTRKEILVNYMKRNQK